jgi:IS1 family transposase
MRAAVFAAPGVWSASIPTPSDAWPASSDNIPTTLTTSSWLFPPRTREVQFDEKWSFVFKKQKNCDPNNPADDHKGDWWDHVAYDPEHKLVLAVVPGARVIENVEEVVAEVKDRLGDQPPELMTSDEYTAYETVIATTFSEVVVETPTGPGRRPILPERHLAPGLTYATVHKERKEDRVVAIDRKVVLGSQEAVERALKASVCSRTINTSFVERQHGTDRHRNARKARKTYRFSKDWCVHEAMTYFTLYSYNFCWPVRTLRVCQEDGRWQRRTPAMAAGLADHVWSLREWVTFPTVQ